MILNIKILRYFQKLLISKRVAVKLIADFLWIDNFAYFSQEHMLLTHVRITMSSTHNSM